MRGGTRVETGFLEVSLTTKIRTIIVLPLFFDNLKISHSLRKEGQPGGERSTSKF